MNELIVKSLRRARNTILPRIVKEVGVPSFEPEFQGQAASNLIKGILERPAPALVARIGHTELRATLRWWDRKSHSLPVRVWKYLSGRIEEFWWDKKIRDEMLNLSGFFPPTNEYLERFARRLIADLEAVDVLGSWLPGEARLSGCMPGARTVRLEDLEPYYHSDPWTSALANKTVLVVHPFEESIRAQYKRREHLFKNKQVLPRFELKTMKSVQSLGGYASGFDSWFDALDSMSERIAGMRFDIAIIGAGAYGLPLGAVVKRLGRNAVHLGGATQILFGIRGMRWDERPFFQDLYNEFWVRPLPDEKPFTSGGVEGGCYW